VFAISVQLSFHERTKLGSSLVIKRRQMAVRGRCSFRVRAGGVECYCGTRGAAIDRNT
jgi:hypothetical protein